MQRLFFITILVFYFSISYGQIFTRTELPTELITPWEITYGPDEFLWLTESEGKVLRVDPVTGEKMVVYTAPDYFGLSPLEESQLCPGLQIGHGTLGLALHPYFIETETAYIYFVYSYNSGTEIDPVTRFRIKRLQWDPVKNEVVNDTNIVNNITNGYDHYGGRLLAIEQDGVPYLILTIGDNGRSELSGDCYDPPSSNPNNFAQDLNFQNGKIHRFNMDGSIPDSNPVSNNSFYTRGHRNPQGLMYNTLSETLYCIEHGDDTDDEINVLNKGMNYGWKDVRGYHDGNLEGEADYVNNYIPNPLIINDALIEPLYSWCTTPATSSTGSNWCTVAPSDGLYYGSATIPEWENSLLVVTLKRGLTTNREVYQFKLQDNGKLKPSTPDNVNPKKFFTKDQDRNGRLRDITVSPDGKAIYLINNGGADASKITVYTYDGVSNVDLLDQTLKPILYPNPASDEINILGVEDLSKIYSVQIINTIGYSKAVELTDNGKIDISQFGKGIHFVKIDLDNQNFILRFVKK